MRQATALLSLLLCATSMLALADDGRRDTLALDALFDRQHLHDADLTVVRRALQLPPEERYDYLSSWVLPGDSHNTLRLTLAFSPTNPAPAADMGLCDETSVGLRASSGGSIFSPALELFRVARKLDKLRQLQRRLEQWDPADTDSHLNRQAMFTLIAFAEETPEHARQELDRLLEMTDQRPAELGPSIAELLVLHEARHLDELDYSLADVMHRYRPWVTATYLRSPLKRQTLAILTRLQAKLSSATTGATPVAQHPMKQWSAVTRATAATRGQGNPNARWDFHVGHVENVASHDEDYLYFNTPLRGNFEVECDVSGFDWRDSHLMVAGEWVAPVYTRSDYDRGNFLRSLGRVKFTPKMTKVDEWIHYRTVVRDGTATTYFNGRRIHERRLTAEHDPWIAIRSSWRHDGAVRDLRITGTPEIPAEIKLSVDSQMGGWLPYFEKAIGHRDSTWRRAAKVEEGGEIRALKVASTPRGNRIYRESLLRYHRPMLEDGTIEYEFFYVPGEVHVHPALDRLAFMLLENGVHLHWITDGEHDRSGLDPANLRLVSSTGQPSTRLPLRANGWNRLALQLVEDTVHLELNGQPIYQRHLEQTNQRTLGLFHFADQTAARVRKVVWRGDWPKHLIAVEEQELAAKATQEIDARLPELSDVFQHNFVTDGLPADRFGVRHADAKLHATARPDGLHTWRAGAAGYPHVSVAPALNVSGDFDIVASFSQLNIDPVQDGTGSVMLKVIAGSADVDEALLYRFMSRRQSEDEHFAQCSRVWGSDAEKRRSFFGRQTVEANSGRLRLARRGDRLYYLFAENDSEHFRIIADEEFTADDLISGGIEMITQAHLEGSRTSVVWKDIVVRAEKITGLGMINQPLLLASLNQQRDQLASHFSRDFTDQAPDSSEFRAWNGSRWQARDRGFKLVHQGTNHWSSTGVGFARRIEGDFDVSIKVRDIRLARPAPALNSAIYLQAEFSNADRTQASVILSDHANRETTVALAQQRIRTRGGGAVYRGLGSQVASSVSSLRLARRGETVFFIATSKDFGGETILAFADLGDAPLELDNLRVILHTGGDGRESQVIWEQIEAHADRILPNSTARAAPTSPVQSVIDFLFR